MPERRMFAKTIVDSDAFLDMPQSSQLLYFHLCMRADDEGFINNPKSIMRNVGCKEDDLKLLFVKKFVIPFESGIVVIKHWKIHNYIQNDRFHETKYKDEKALLEYDENKAYRLTNGYQNDECIQDVYIMDTEVRLGKVSIGKYNNTIAQNETDEMFQKFWDEYPKKVGKANACKAFKKYCKDDETLQVMLKALRVQKESKQWKEKNGQFIPYPATWLNGERWNDEVEGKKGATIDEIWDYQETKLDKLLKNV